MFCSCLNADHGVGGLMWVKTAPAVIPCNNTLFCADCKAAAASAVRTDSRCLLCVKCEGSSRRRSSSWIYLFFLSLPSSAAPLLTSSSFSPRPAGWKQSLVCLSCCLSRAFFFFFCFAAPVARQHKQKLLAGVCAAAHLLQCRLFLLFSLLFNSNVYLCI